MRCPSIFQVWEPGAHGGLQKRPKISATWDSRPSSALGLDFLTFLAATVLVIPVFKSVKASPVLGFLFSGLVLGQLGCAFRLVLISHKNVAFPAWWAVSYKTDEFKAKGEQLDTCA